MQHFPQEEAILSPAPTPKNPRRTTDRIDRHAATATLLRRCKTLDEPAASVAMVVAWQRTAVDHVAVPRFHRVRFPLLNELPDPPALVAALRELAEIWPHLAEHVPHLEQLCSAVTDWGRVTQSIGADLIRACCHTNSGWPDPAGDVLQAFRSSSSSRKQGAFYTPPELCSLMVALQPPAAGDAIIDSACGTGRLLATAARAVPDPIRCGFFGIDLDADAIAIAALNLIAAGAGPHVWLHRGNAFTTRFVDTAGHELAFDLALANPPFAGKSSVDSLGPVSDVVVDPRARLLAWLPDEDGSTVNRAA